MLQLAFREQVIPADSIDAFRILDSREFGASAAILALARQLGLYQVLYSRAQPWVNAVLAMVVGRLVYAGSKLSPCNHHPNTCLWELCGIDEPDVDDHCCQPLDQLLARQRAIQKGRANLLVPTSH